MYLLCVNSHSLKFIGGFQIFIFSIALLAAPHVCGQCPESHWLWNRLIFLRDSSSRHKLSYQEILKELLAHEKEISTCDPSYDSTRVLLYQRIGVTYYRLKNYEAATQYGKNSILLFNRLPNPMKGEPKFLTNSYYLLSVIYDSVENKKLQAQALDSLLFVSFRIGTGDIYALYVLDLRIRDLIGIGDYQKAFDYAEMGQRMANEVYSRSDSVERFTKSLPYLLFKAESLIHLRKTADANALIRPEIIAFAEKKSPEDLGELYYRKGLITMNQEKYPEAIQNFEKSILSDAKLGRFLYCVKTLNNVGFFLYHNAQKNEPMAIKTYRRALQFARMAMSAKGSADSIAVRAEYLNIFANIADAYSNLHAYDSAFSNIRRALDQIRPGIDERALPIVFQDEILSNAMIVYTAYLLIYEGRAALNSYPLRSQKSSLMQALQSFHIADQLLMKLKTEQRDISSQLFWRNDFHELYESAIEASSLLGNLSEAFYFIEKDKAVLLNDELNQITMISHADIHEEAKLKKKMLAVESSLNEKGLSEKDKSNKQNERIKTKQELEQIEQTIRDKNPIYYKSYLDTSATTLELVKRNLLEKGSSLLELFEGDKAVYAILVTSDREWIHKIDKKDYDSTSARYYSFISTPLWKEDQFDEFILTASRLYKIIFGDELLPKGRMIISPDGNYFPFEALVKNVQTSGHTYFFHDHYISYTYSARFLLSEFENNQELLKENFFGIAPVNYGKSIDVDPLLESDQSLERIADHFDHANNLTGENASRNHFLQTYAGYRIVQLYTHAAERSDRGEPVIFFYDSALYLSELIPDKRPSTRLIVLSACETGLGKLYRGEGVFSFNRAFASIGIPSAIINLWDVDNRSTYQLTELFYKYLAQGLETDQALQQAKLDFLSHASKEKSLPYYWAATVLAGKSATLINPTKSGWHWLLISIAIAFLGLVTRAITRTRKK